MLPSIWALPRHSAAACTTSPRAACTHDPASGPDSLCPTPLVQLDQHADRFGLAVEVPGVAVQLFLGDPSENGLQRKVVRDQVTVIAQPPMRGGLAHAVRAETLGQAGFAAPLAH